MQKLHVIYAHPCLTMASWSTFALQQLLQCMPRCVCTFLCCMLRGLLTCGLACPARVPSVPTTPKITDSRKAVQSHELR